MDQFNQPYYINVDEDICYYFLEYTSKVGYNYNDSNNIVFNFKSTHPNSIRYKRNAISYFANLIINDISNLLPKDTIYIAAPTSKTRNSALFDDRLDQVVNILNIKGLSTSLKLEALSDITPSHSSGQNRNITDIKNNIIFYGFDPTRFQVNDFIKVAIVDDVITTGAHFKACKERILEKYPKAIVYGIFLAKTVWIN